MAKGDTIKLKFTNMLQAAFGENFIGVSDKKIYIQGEENGEKVQIAITLTCPKAQIAKTQTSAIDNSSFTQEELDIIEKLKSYI